MLIYIIIFFVAFILSLLAKKFYLNKKLFILFSFLAILIPSLLAGFRIVGIGTDTRGYVATTFLYTGKCKNIINCMIIIDIEPLYSALNYIVHIFTNNIHFLYFLVQILILSFAYAACVKNDDEKKELFPLYFLIFLLLYYNRSLNMVRQSIALSIFLFAYYYLKNKKTIKYFLLTILAIGFHNSAFVMIPIYFIYNFVKEKNKNKILIFSILCILVLLYDNIGMFLINNLHIIPSRYEYYFSISKIRTLLIIELIFKVFILFLGLKFIKKLTKLNSENSMIVYFLMLDLLVYLLAIKFNYAQRLSYYFSYLNVFIIPQFIYVLKNSKDYKKINVLKICLILCITAYSIVFYGIRKYDETVPYKSIIFDKDSYGG